MLNLETIKQPIRDEMALFERKFHDAMRSRTPLLDRIMHYIVKRKGKQMRPMFVFLSAGVCGEITESAYTGASLIELLHTATLVHDDVVDDSNLRRGFFSINALWKNKIAVLVGDYLLSRGLLISVANREYELLEIVSNAVREMSEGELLQIEKARRLDIDEPVYFEIIRQKTASLIASCCAVGAASAKAGTEKVGRMQQFGEKAGIAFQIKDDLFDFEKNLATGKPSGMDIRESKMTLPLIHALSQAGGSEKRKIIGVVKKRDARDQEVAGVIRFVNENGGLEYARKKMNDFQQDAFGLIAAWPDSPYKKSLEELVRFTTERTH